MRPGPVQEPRAGGSPGRGPTTFPAACLPFPGLRRRGRAVSAPPPATPGHGVRVSRPHRPGRVGPGAPRHPVAVSPSRFRAVRPSRPCAFPPVGRAVPLFGCGVPAAPAMPRPTPGRAVLFCLPGRRVGPVGHVARRPGPGRRRVGTRGVGRAGHIAAVGGPRCPRSAAASAWPAARIAALPLAVRVSVPRCVGRTGRVALRVPVAPAAPPRPWRPCPCRRWAPLSGLRAAARWP